MSEKEKTICSTCRYRRSCIVRQLVKPKECIDYLESKSKALAQEAQHG